MNHPKDVESALCVYFNKIRSAEDVPYPKSADPALLAQIQNGQFVIPRNIVPDTAGFESENGFRLPEALLAYFRSYHPCVMGQHPKNPHKKECLILHASVSHDALNALRRDMMYWAEFDADFRYLPIGFIACTGAFVALERATGRIWVEYPFADDPANDEEGRLWPEPIAESLAELIAELDPYPAKKGDHG